MGTNYYFENVKKCEHCGQETEELIHFGKTSYGWKFLFDCSKLSLDEILKKLEDSETKIIDEYTNRWMSSEILVKVLSMQHLREHSRLCKDFKIGQYNLDYSLIEFS